MIPTAGSAPAVFLSCSVQLHKLTTACWKVPFEQGASGGLHHHLRNDGHGHGLSHVHGAHAHNARSSLPATLPDIYMTRAQARQIIADMRENGTKVPVMMPDEINAEIAAARDER